MIFFNRSGTPSVYMDDGSYIYFYNGECAAYIFNGSIHHFDGRHLGFFKNGWIRDKNGKCVLFTQNAKGGPERRMKDIGRIKSQKSGIPGKKPRESILKKLDIKEEWSELSSIALFKQ